MSNTSHCINCGAYIPENQKYCGQCGQLSHVHRFTIVHFFHEFFHAFTHADKGIFHLLAGLATQPGKVAREYIGGKRKKYFNPFTFFLIMMGIYVLSSQLFSTPDPESTIPAGIQRIPNENARAKAIAMYERGMQVRKFTTKNGNIMSMVAIPLIAFVFWIFYRGRQCNYAEHLTANMMFTTFANLVFTLLIFPLQKWAGPSFSPWAIYLAFLLQAVYYTWAYTQFFKARAAGAYVKAFFVSVFAVLLWFFFSTSLMALYIYQSGDFYQFFSRMFR